MSSSVVALISRHTLRQVKFILPGGLATWYLESHREFLRIWYGEVAQGTLAQTFAWITAASALTTFFLFIYVLLVPLIQGEQPNYSRWRQSGLLSNVIPILTVSIIIGWSTLSYLLARWSSLGIIEGVLGASGLYALAFGLLGLIPAPKVRRS